MSRPTNLKILSERSVVLDEHEDTRPASEVFTKPPAPVVSDPQLAQDVLALLRQSHDRIQSEVANVNATAQEAVRKVDTTQEVVQRAAQTATEAKQIAGRALTANASAATIHATGTTLLNTLKFLADRAPSLFALVGGWLLAQQILTDPTTVKLAGLALYSAGVIAPATWLSSKKV